MSIHISREIDEALGDGWVRRRLTGFADDLHFRWRFWEAGGCVAATQEMQVVLDVLQTLQFTVSDAKTVAMLRVAGGHSAQMRRRTLCKQDGQLCVKAGSRLIPYVSTHVYLGAKISYARYEDLNVQHRLLAA